MYLIGVLPVLLTLWIRLTVEYRRRLKEFCVTYGTYGD
jgi:hypothetical protein